MTAKDRFMDLDSDLCEVVTARYAGYLIDGYDAVGWYQREAGAVAALANHVGLDPVWLAGLTAALSPVISVKGNALRVLRAIQAWQSGATWEAAVAGLPCTPGSVKTHALAFLAKGWQGLGPKTGPFGRNLSGQGVHVTVDTWMCQAAGVPHASVARSSSPERLACEAACAALADALDIQPAAAQAAVWYGVRRAKGVKDSRDSLAEVFAAWMAGTLAL